TPLFRSESGKRRSSLVVSEPTSDLTLARSPGWETATPVWTALSTATRAPRRSVRAAKAALTTVLPTPDPVPEITSTVTIRTVVPISRFGIAGRPDHCGSIGCNPTQTPQEPCVTPARCPLPTAWPAGSPRYPSASAPASIHVPPAPYRRRERDRPADSSVYRQDAPDSPRRRPDRSTRRGRSRARQRNSRRRPEGPSPTPPGTRCQAPRHPFPGHVSVRASRTRPRRCSTPAAPRRIRPPQTPRARPLRARQPTSRAGHGTVPLPPATGWYPARGNVAREGCAPACPAPCEAQAARHTARWDA